ncbi:OmpA family protein [Sulfuricurvum sp.]|uniref:OmpA family protein n=1 Tax=Sulfuricurvum sp. TaxID=2025608 RepID=UPI002E35149B|nr:OmpA family protein [Sulfuricurvum sp.]HEX5329787.1 OmpA family protein [Sulfuricurvum sp.]
MMPFIFSGQKTTVILLDNNKTTNGITITTQGGSVDIDIPNTQTVLSSQEAKPEPLSSVEVSVIEQKYVQAFEALPSHPVSLLFYFKSGSTELTSESRVQMSALIDLIKEREPCVVDIIGNTDTKASFGSNYNLGLERAKMLKSFLEEQHIQLSEVHIESYGESNLLVPTVDEIDEPRNRRVEVLVR